MWRGTIVLGRVARRDGAMAEEKRYGGDCQPVCEASARHHPLDLSIEPLRLNAQQSQQ